MLVPEVCAVSYSRVSSDRQDVELSISGQQRAIREWSEKNGYTLVGEYVDEAESGRIDTRDGFSQMIRDACAPNPGFRTILVWKHDRFSRRREHAVVYKARLRDRGVRLVSISEPSDDTPSGRLLEAIIEGLVEYYSENLSEDVARGMREAALRGNFFGPKAPFGYRRVKTLDSSGRVRNTLEVVTEEAVTVLYVFQCSLEGRGLKEIGKDLDSRGITNRGRRWHRNSLHWLLTNEASTGMLVWGRRPTRVRNRDPVRVEGAWPAIVSREMFDQVQQCLAERAPVKRPVSQRPVFLLTGLLTCGSCGNQYMVHAAKSNRYFYYVCRTLHHWGAGACQTNYFNAPVTDQEFVRRFTQSLSSTSGLSWLADSATAEMRAAANDYSSVLDEVKTTLAGIDQLLEESRERLESQSLSTVSTLPPLSFLQSRKEQLTALQNEVSRSARRIDQMAAYYGSDGAKYSMDGMLQEFLERLADGPVLEQREAIKLLVERIVVDCNGEFDIQTKVPLYIPP